MLAIAEVVVPSAARDAMREASYSWFGHMVDAGFLQAGWVDERSGRVWLVLAGAGIAEIKQRLAVLPGIREGEATIDVTPVTALRFR